MESADTRQRKSPGWIIIGFTGVIVAGFLLKLILFLAGHLTPVADSVLDVIVFGALAVTFGVRGVQALRSDLHNRGIAAGFAFVGAACWIVYAATIVAHLAAL